MRNQADYSKYKCPYEQLEYADSCEFRKKGCPLAPVFCLDPKELGLQLKETTNE